MSLTTFLATDIPTDCYELIMITRGHYIGRIIDEFSAIQSQVSMRCKLGLTDLNVVVESFFRDVLNEVLSAQLENLNDERSNSPGLDLGDQTSGIAFQVTSSGNSAKVKKTLEKITPTHRALYPKIYMLIIGDRQKKYTLDDDIIKTFHFKKSNIWDLTTVSRKALNLPLDRLERLHRLVQNETVRVRVELEVPDAEGRYPTNGYDRWEALPKPKAGSGVELLRYFSDNGWQADEPAKMEVAISRAVKNLARLPRITREFLAVLYERREQGQSNRGPDRMGWILLDSVKRQFGGTDLEGELRLLEHAGFACIDADDIRDSGPPELVLRISKNNDLNNAFCGFVEDRKLSYRRVIGDIDFSKF